MWGAHALEHCRLRVVKIRQAENNHTANKILALLAHTSGLQTTCTHRRYFPIQLLSVQFINERTRDRSLVENAPATVVGLALFCCNGCGSHTFALSSR
jgi:hypothetical protein